jgi:hypothetical protein
MRDDIHRPSVINPADYEFVGVECDNVEELGDLLLLAEERKRIQAHMASTGGTYSRHTHGGNCHVCGAHAIYTTLFWHRPTNVYVRLGFDCTDNMFGNGDDFRPIRNRFEAVQAEVRTARENKAGRNKAALVLEDAGLLRAWEIFSSSDEMLLECGGTRIERIAVCDCPYRMDADTVGQHCVNCNKVRKEQSFIVRTHELHTLRSIVDRLVKYGSISEKVEKYLEKLVYTIDHRAKLEAERDAQREAERAAAADCPEGRLVVRGRVRSVKQVETQYGMTWKMLVQSEHGWKCYGTVPQSIAGEIGPLLKWYSDGETATLTQEVNVTVTATLTRSPNDEKFGFFKRPAKATLEVLAGP